MSLGSQGSVPRTATFDVPAAARPLPRPLVLLAKEAQGRVPRDTGLCVLRPRLATAGAAFSLSDSTRSTTEEHTVLSVFPDLGLQL